MTSGHPQNYTTLTDVTRALDPEELAKHVADNNTAFIGEHLGHLATIAKLGHNTANETKAALANLKDTTQNIAATKQQLAAVANRLEERDARSKWDWVTLVAGMAVAALLAGGGTVYWTKQNLDTANFRDAIRLIQNDKDSYWCDSAGARPIQDSANNWFCPVRLMGYQPAGKPAN